MSNLTQEQALQMERLQNVYIDIDNEMYTRGDRDYQYGWAPIPQEWIAEIENIGEPVARLKDERRLFFVGHIDYLDLATDLKGKVYQVCISGCYLVGVCDDAPLPNDDDYIDWAAKIRDSIEFF